MAQNDIYEVDRETYKSFFQELKPSCRRTEKIMLDENTVAIETTSINTGAVLCRRTYDNLEEHIEPERYYIFTMPESDERREIKPTLQIRLETPQEVQAFFDLLNRRNKTND